MLFEDPLSLTSMLHFESDREFNEHLMKEYIRVVNELTRLTEEKRKIVAKVDERAEPGPLIKTSGVAKLDGVELKGSVTRSTSPKYIEKEDTPLLQRVYEGVEEAREHIGFKFTERQAAMSKYLASIQSEDKEAAYTELELKLLREIIECRSLETSMPQVKVQLK